MKQRKEEVRDSRQSDLQGFAYLKPIEGINAGHNNISIGVDKTENIDLKDLTTKSVRMSQSNTN